MKKLKPIICILMICATFLLSFLTFSPVANVGAISGDWSSYTSIPTEEGGCFLIGTAQELSWFNQNKNNEQHRKKNVKLTANIDLSAHYWSPTYDGSGLDKNWGAIFDGCGYKIYGLTTSSSGTETYAGLFSYTFYGTTIKNIIFENCAIEGTHTASGIVAGYFDGTTINVCYFNNCSLNVTISDGSLTGAGGVVGFAHASNISDCYMNGLTITATGTTNRVGGIIGYQYNSNVSICSVDLGTKSIAVTGTTNYVGGITGELFNTAPDSNSDGYINSDDTWYKVQKCFLTNGSISSGSTSSSTSAAGGIVGVMRSGCKIENCFNKSDITASAKTTSAAAVEFEAPLDNDLSSLLCDQYKKATIDDVYICKGTRTDSGAKGNYKNNSYKSNYVIKTVSAYAGGIVGYAANSSGVTGVYSIGTISSAGRSYYYYTFYFKYFKEGLFGVHHYDYGPGSITATSKYRYYKGNIIGYMSGDRLKTSLNYVYAESAIGSYTEKISLGTFDNSFSHSGGEGSPYLKVGQGGRVKSGTTDTIEVYNYAQTERNNGKTSVIYTKTIPCETSTPETLTGNDITAIATSRSDYWAIDSKYNDGDPIIRDFYWEYSTKAP